MIFDSISMQKLRKRYADISDFRVPQIVVLDRLELLAGERLYLEGLIQSVPAPKQQDWLAKLISDDEGKHIGAWFEMMLYGWLKQSKLGPIIVEPEIEGDRPDFCIEVNGLEIIIEAQARIIKAKEREYRYRYAELLSLLKRILEQTQESYAIQIKKCIFGVDTVKPLFERQIVNWLKDSPQVPFNYIDDANNEFILVAEANQPRIVWGISEWTKSVPPIRPFRKKAQKHKAVRDAGYPYVIAVFLENPKETSKSAESVWLGEVATVIATSENEPAKIIDQYWDGSGLLFGRKVFTETISGSLVFKSEVNEVKRCRELKAWYIQNPDADPKIELDKFLFPAMSRFVVTETGVDGPKMGWV